MNGINRSFQGWSSGIFRLFTGFNGVAEEWEHIFTVLICETRLGNMTFIKYVLVSIHLSCSAHDLQQDVRRLDVSLRCRSSQGFSSHSDRPPCWPPTHSYTLWAESHDTEDSFTHSFDPRGPVSLFISLSSSLTLEGSASVIIATQFWCQLWWKTWQSLLKCFVSNEEYLTDYLVVNINLHQIWFHVGICCPPVDKQRKFTSVSQHIHSTC